MTLTSPASMVARDTKTTTDGLIDRDVTAVVVTYNSVDTIAALVGDLRGQMGDLRLRVVVVDNASQDGTCEVARAAGADVIEAGGNLGFAGGLNRGIREAAVSRAMLLLNADLRIPHSAVRALWDRLQGPGVGMVVPKLFDANGSSYPSLRFEPTLARALGDALLGAKASHRPVWATEMDFDEESYNYPHPVDWATGAAILVSSETIERVGELYEGFFLYSEETDYMRRVRDAGLSIWYEPQAVLTHAGQGSGTSPELSALMAVNRVRYAERHHGSSYARVMRLLVTLAALLRIHRGPEPRRALRYLVHRGSWAKLPHAMPSIDRRVSPPISALRKP